ncbi:hypothetical protein PINS_up004775 [Pythium insidiosum]|nr:hypothetical protein PINS_up004775 [Pythium insidiosum]
MTADPDVERLEALRRRQEERQKRCVRPTKRAATTTTTTSRARRNTNQKDDATENDGTDDADASAVAAAMAKSFDALRQRRFLYVAGVDHSGDPVFAFLAGQLPTDSEELECVLPFVCHTLDVVKDSQFSVLFLLEDASTDETSWLKRFFSTLATKYERSLRFLYVLEPTMWLRLLLAVSRGLGLSGSFYSKIVYLSSARELVHISDALQLPSSIAFPSAKEERGKQEQPHEENEPTETRPPLLPSDSARAAGAATLATAFMRAGRHAVL